MKNLTQFTLILAAALTVIGCSSVEIEDNVHMPGFNADTINGSIKVGSNSVVGNLDTVNGSVTVGAATRTGHVDTVNGGIEFGDDAICGRLDTVNGSVSLGRNAQIHGNIDTVNGAIHLRSGSKVDGNIDTVNGNIALTAVEVAGDILSVNSDLDMREGSVVLGGIHYQESQGLSFNIGSPPKIVIGPNSRVEGTLRFDREVRLYVHDSAEIGPVLGANVERFAGLQP